MFGGGGGGGGKSTFWFSLQLLSKTTVILRIWIILKYFRRILKCQTSMLHADGRMDRHDEANSRFSKFCESAYKKEKKQDAVKLVGCEQSCSHSGVTKTQLFRNVLLCRVDSSDVSK